MKTLLIFLLLFSPFVKAEGPGKKERKYASNFLDETEKTLFRSVKNLTPEQWNYQASDDGWSIGGICEHLLLVENSIYQLVTAKIMKDDANKTVAGEDKLTNEQLIAFIADRSPEKRVKTGAALEPQGIFATPASFMEEYHKTRNVTQAYIENTEDQLMEYYAPISIGKISAYQWFLLLGAHNQRHLNQIEEIMASEQYPA